MARRIILAALLALTLLCTGTPAATAQPDTPPSDGSGICQTVGDTAGAAASIVPGLGTVVDGAATVLCEAGGNPAVAVQQVVTGKYAEMWKKPFGEIVQSILDGMGQLVLMSMSWWIAIPNPDLANMTAMQTISEYTFEIQLLLLTASIIFVAAKVANARRHARADATEESFRILMRTVLSAGVFAAVIAALTRAGDAFANWVLSETSNDNPRLVAETLLSLNSYSTAAPGLMLLVGVIGILGALAQAALLVVRQAMLILVVAVLPVAAAAGGTEVGQQSYHKLTAWIIAFLLFKPVAALAYGIAFLSAAQPGSNPVVGDGEQFQTALVGMILLICTAAVLPALMRVITPAVGAVGSGGSGLGAAGGVLMAGAAVATGGKALAAGKAVGTAGATGAFSGTATAASPAGAGRGAGGGGGGGGGRGGAPPAPGPRPSSPAAGGGRRTGNGAGSRPPAGRATATSARAARAAGAAAGAASAGGDGAAGDLAGDRLNRSPDMGRHTIRP